MVKQIGVVQFLIGLVATVALTVVWSYSTFVTRNERDAMREIYNQRLIAVEQGYTKVLESSAILSGKMDSMLLLIDQSHSGRRGK